MALAEAIQLIVLVCGSSVATLIIKHLLSKRERTRSLKSDMMDFENTLYDAWKGVAEENISNSEQCREDIVERDREIIRLLRVIQKLEANGGSRDQTESIDKEEGEDTEEP